MRNNIAFKYIDCDLGHKVLVKCSADITATELVDNFLAFAQGITFDKITILDAMKDRILEEESSAEFRRLQKDI